MWEDEIVAEVREARAKYVAEHHYDIDDIYADMKQQEQTSKRSVVHFPPKRPAKDAIPPDDSVDAA